MRIDAETLDESSTYRLLVGAVVPRPIAWVTSGIPPVPTNLAPFSAFAWVSHYPAMLGINVLTRGDRYKDTARNIARDGEYVINIASEDLLQQLHASSEGFDADVSEAEVVGLELAPSAKVGPPRLAAAPVSMECVLHETLSFGSTGSQFIVGEVVSFHVRDDLYSNGKIDVQAMRPVGRLAGPTYTTLGQVVKLPRVPGG